jgi:hypothetical protein
LPEGYVVIKKDHKTLSEGKAEVHNELNKRFQSGRYLGGTEYSNAMLTVGLDAAPTIPLTTLAQVMPVLSMGTHIHDSGLMTKTNFDMENFANLFPSGTFMCNKVYHYATMCTAQNAKELEGKKVHLATDKGKIHMLYVYM